MVPFLLISSNCFSGHDTSFSCPPTLRVAAIFWSSFFSAFTRAWSFSLMKDSRLRGASKYKLAIVDTILPRSARALSSSKANKRILECDDVDTLPALRYPHAGVEQHMVDRVADLAEAPLKLIEIGRGIAQENVLQD